MTEYRPPLADMEFVLRHVSDLDGLAQLPGFEHATSDVVTDLLAEAGRFMAEQLAPLNHPGDVEGSRWNPDGSVTTPQGFIAAYHAYVEAGWGTVPFDAEHGGGEFPWAVGLALQEMMTSANMSFSMCPLLTQGSIDLLEAHGSDALKALYLPKMVTGEWTGTMVLTEPDAGSDVGSVRTKAVPEADGSWRITGNKIFITFGEHDMADNIVHLVLARVPDAPPGTKGISCFVVPKFIPGPDGSPGDRNDVVCVSIEHKLGIKASPTCVLGFGEGRYGDGRGAVGWLVGEPNRGMSYMFTMMNQARLSVGLEGLALAERSYQQALAYANERRQGRAVGAPPGTTSLIVEHPDVRRNLLTMKSQIEAMRRLLYWNAAEIDRARRSPDPEDRQRADEVAALLTPLSKSWCTDLAVSLTGIGVQIHGGMGFIEETGIAQHYRDARITTIYEGTNGIQGMDLVGRKLPMRGGGVVQDHLARLGSVDRELAEAGDDLAGMREELARSLEALTEATLWLAGKAGEPNDVLAGATPYLNLMAATTAGWLMARSALAARADQAAGRGDAAFLEAKVTTARFFCEQILPPYAGLARAVMSGAAPLYEASPEALAL